MENHLAVLFRKLNVAHRIVVQEYLDQHGLYIGQPRFLFALYSKPGMSQGQLTKELSLSKETVSVTVRRLEQTGFVQRVTSDIDKRIRLLYLSEKGENLMPELKSNFKEINERMFSLLDQQEREMLESLYEKMIQGIERSFD